MLSGCQRQAAAAAISGGPRGRPHHVTLISLASLWPLEDQQSPRFKGSQLFFLATGMHLPGPQVLGVPSGGSGSSEAGGPVCQDSLSFRIPGGEGRPDPIPGPLRYVQGGQEPDPKVKLN